MKLNISDSLLNDLHRNIYGRITGGRISPSPVSRLDNLYRCSLTEVEFTGLLDESNCLIIMDRLTFSDDMRLYTVHPEVLRRLREFLLYEGKWVIITRELFSTETAVQFHSIKWMIGRSPSLRAMYPQTKFVFDGVEWGGAVKMALTDDWQSTTVYELNNNRLDVNYLVDLLNYIWAVVIRPPVLYWSLLHTMSSPSLSRPKPQDIWEIVVTPDGNDIQDCFRRFKEKWWRMTYPAEELETGVLHFSSAREMYASVTPVLINLGQHLTDQSYYTLDVNAYTGVRFWNVSYKKFHMRYEEF